MDEKNRYQLVETGDGSYSLFSSAYQESYHSRGGALTEARDRFIGPCRIREIAREKGEVSILEVGFGLGVNLAATLYALKEVEGLEKISYTTTEMDRDLLAFLPQVPIPDELAAEFAVVHELARAEQVVDDGRELHLLVGDARETLTSIEGPFDAVYLDAFSPKKNPELWTVDFFRELHRLITPEGLVSTYSMAARIRLAFLAAGFAIGPGPKAAHKTEGTLASPRGEVPSFPEKYREKMIRRLAKEYPNYTGPCRI